VKWIHLAYKDRWPPPVQDDVSHTSLPWFKHAQADKSARAHICTAIFYLVLGGPSGCANECYSKFFVRPPPHVISLQLCTPKVVGV
jgi:hypothetical protein